MSIWLQAAKQGMCRTDKLTELTEPPEPRVSAPTKSREIAPAGVLSVLSVRQFKRDDDSDTFRHGRSITGDPQTWTGRIVSLDAWRSLSAWDRHGPDGRLWCGACRYWVGSCPHIDAPDRN